MCVVYVPAAVLEETPKLSMVCLAIWDVRSSGVGIFHFYSKLALISFVIVVISPGLANFSH